MRHGFLIYVTVPIRFTKDSPKFDIVHVAYYFGAFIIMSAMGWFMNDAWNKFGGGSLVAIATMYAIGFVLAGRHFWFREGLKVPAGLLFTLAVWMTPLAVFGLLFFWGGLSMLESTVALCVIG